MPTQSSNTEALDLLDAQIARLRKLKDTPQEIATAVAKELEAQLLGNIAAGRGPDGVAWQPTADGHRPLQGAGKALRVVAIGTSVIASLVGYHARHHLGAVKGKIRRRILPTRRLLGPLGAAIRAVIEKRMRAALTGGAA